MARLRELFRVGVPVNVRNCFAPGASAANIVGMVFLDRSPVDLRDSQRLLRGISREMNQVKRHDLGMAVLRAFAVATRLPNGLSRMVPTDRCLTTIILSNAGRIFADLDLPTDRGRVVAGNLTLEHVRVFPAARPWTRAVIQALTYAGRLDVCLGYNPNDFTADESSGFIERLMNRLRESASSQSIPAESALREFR